VRGRLRLSRAHRGLRAPAGLGVAPRLLRRDELCHLAGDATVGTVERVVGILDPLAVGRDLGHGVVGGLAGRDETFAQATEVFA